MKKLNLLLIPLFSLTIGYLYCSFVYSTFDSTKFPIQAKWATVIINNIILIAVIAIIYDINLSDKLKNNKGNEL